MDINAAVGGKAGLERAKIEAALGMKASSDLSERERVALEYADRVSATPVDVPDEFFANLQRLFSEREIVELTAHIAHENYNAKSNRPLRVVANDFCDIPLSTTEGVTLGMQRSSTAQPDQALERTGAEAACRDRAQLLAGRSVPNR